MLFRKRFRFMNEAGDGGAAGGAPGAGDGAAPGSQPGGDPGAGAQPGGDQSLLKQPDPYAWLDQKFRVNTADGKLDLEASSKKLNESYGALSKRLGTGEVAPGAPSDYAFKAPEQFKDVKLDDAMSQTFRERAHKLGLSPSQYQGVMESYLELVPGVLDSVLKLSQSEAKASLQKVWPTQAQYDAGLQDAQRMIDSLPSELGQEAWARFGRDPLFFQIAAKFGSEMREDKSPGAQTGGGANQTAEQLMKSDAYRDPKHPEHAATSEKVRNLFAQQHGAQAMHQ